MKRNRNEEVAIVTGGAQGLGREISMQLSARGWRIAIADSNKVSGSECARACNRQGGEAIFVHVQLETAKGPEGMVNTAVRRFGRLDALINCAAYATAEGFLEMTAQVWEQMLLVNVRAIALATSAAARHMIPRGRGRIINVTSPASRMALPHYSAYAASKAAVDSLTRSAAVALAPKNIQVNSISPGMMDTPMQLHTETLFAALEGQNDLDAFRATRTARIPSGRRATCAEIAAAVVWMTCDAPQYMTAERMNVSGGLDKD
jgi:3-oxoacyl-[acyl-carrier protein] reductase